MTNELTVKGPVSVPLGDVDTNADSTVSVRLYGDAVFLLNSKGRDPRQRRSVPTTRRRASASVHLERSPRLRRLRPVRHPDCLRRSLNSLANIHAVPISHRTKIPQVGG